MIEIAGTNWLAVIAATIAYYVLGALWFSPLALGPAWDRAIGFERPRGWKPSTLYYVGPLLGCLAATVATSLLLNALRPGSLLDAAALGLVVGIGYCAAVSAVNAITPKTPRPLSHGFITGAYHAAGITLAAVILAGVP